MFATYTKTLKSHSERRPRGRQALTGAVLCALALLLIPPTAAAQETGSVAGSVETHGERIVLAVARIPALGISTAVSADGAFRFDEVPAGTYLVVVDIPAFGTASETVTVTGGDDAEVELEMRHGTHFDEVVVTATGDLRRASELANPVSVLSGTDLQLRLGATLGETLEGEPGVHSTSFVPGAGRPIIRGLSGARIRVMENGLDTGDASVVSADHAVTFEPAHAEQIEVLRGPATLRFGSEAIGGAVNMVDGRIPSEKPVSALRGTIDLRGGSVADERMGAIHLNGGGGEWAWHLGAVSRETDPYEIPGHAQVEEEHDDHDEDHDDHDEDHDEDEDHDDEDEDHDDHDDEDHDDEDHDEHEDENPFGIVPNTDLMTESGRFGFTRFFGDRGSIGISVSGFNTDYGLPPGAHAHHEHEDEHDHDDEDHDDEDHDDEDHDDEDHDDEDHDDEDHDDEDHDDEDHDDEDHDDHDDEHGHEEEELPIRVDMRQRRVDLRAEALPMAGAFQKIEVRMTGTDYEHVELEGPDVGTTFSNDYLETRLEMFQRERGRSRGSVGLQYSDRDLAAIGEEAFVPPTQSQGWALFTSQEIEAGPVRWQFGARFEQLDHNPVSSRDTSHDGVSASAGLVWDAGADWTLGVSVARSARLPAAEELHSDGLHVATLSYEVGDPNLDNETGTGFDVSLRKTEGLLTGELTLFSQSFSDFIYQRFTGEEEDGFAVLRYTQADASTEGAELRLRLELLDRNDHHLHIQAIADTVNAELDAGGNLPRIPPMTFGAGLHYHGHHWRAAVEGRWFDDQNDVAELETPTEGYTLVNAHVGRRFILGNQILDVLLRGRNLTDEEARVHTSFLKNFRPLPGRDVTLSARFWF